MLEIQMQITQTTPTEEYSMGNIQQRDSKTTDEIKQHFIQVTFESADSNRP